MLLGENGNIKSIIINENREKTNVILGGKCRTVYGADYITDELCSLEFRISPLSFYQVNHDQAERLYDQALEYAALTGNERVIDLYCGIGTIGICMAEKVKKVIGVEIVEEAVRAAEENAAQNNIGNCRFIAGDVLHVLKIIPEKPDVIVLDPPRDGIHPKALPQILSYGVDRILYIACKPKSFARDLPAFLGAGYKPVRAVCVDEFPWTANVELITLLSR